MLAQPICLAHDDGFQTEIAERADGSLSVLVSAPGGRNWATWRSTIEEAVAVSDRILSDQRARIVLDAGFASA